MWKWSLFLNLALKIQFSLVTKYINFLTIISVLQSLCFGIFIIQNMRVHLSITDYSVQNKLTIYVLAYPTSNEYGEVTATPSLPPTTYSLHACFPHTLTGAGIFSPFLFWLLLLKPISKDLKHIAVEHHGEENASNVASSIGIAVPWSACAFRY